MSVNSKELLKHAFTVAKELKAGKLSVEEAKAHANLLKQSNNILKYELDKAIAIQKYEGIEIQDVSS